MPSSAPEPCDVLWPWAYRVIPSRFPPINVFERYYESGEEMEIAFALEEVVTPRPMTHDLVTQMLSELNAEVSRITVTELRENTFYALITLWEAFGGG